MRIFDDFNNSSHLHNLLMQPRFRYFLAILFVLFIVTTSIVVSFANVNDFTSKRNNFSEAIAALEVGQYKKFLSLKQQNKDYILFPYLEYYDLQQRISTASNNEIVAFVEKYKDTPLSSRLKSKWLLVLGKNNRWRDFVKHYDGQSSVKLRCYNLRARLILDSDKKANVKALQEAKQLWLVGNTQPKECIPLFKKLYANSIVTTELLWARIELSMRQGNLKLVSHLSSKLNNSDKKSVELWQQVYKNPTKKIHSKKLQKNTVINRKIIVHAIKRIARSDANEANNLWGRFIKSHGFSVEQKAELKRHMAIHAASQFLPISWKMLNQVDPGWVNNSVKIWKIKVALKEQNWRILIDEIQSLSEVDQKQLKWQYWLARAQEMLNQQNFAREIYESIAKKTNYYGFLAADRIGTPYTFVSTPIKRNTEKLRALQALPGIQRAKELYLLDRTTDARREWNLVIKSFDEFDLKQAAIIAHNWQWHENAISTIAKTNHREDLDLRFPTPYRDEILLNAETMSIDPAWIFGVARRESAFKEDARSHKGAIGLMQILLSTAQLQSKILGLNKPNLRELFLAERNIFFGSSYLNSMLDRFSGNQVLATAAYNAGPNRVAKWLGKTNNVSADLWVDMIPYKETRQYVRAVMAYSTIFDWKLNSEPTVTLKMRMKPISDSYALLK